MNLEENHIEIEEERVGELLHLKRCSQGNREPFSVLYGQYLDEIYRYIFLFTKSKAVSEELVQDLFLKIWLNKEKLEQVQSFKSYLYRSAKNLVIDFYRRQEVENRFINEVKNLQEVETKAGDELLIFQESYKIAQKAIEALPKKRKEIFEMRTQKELSLDEIAAELNISKSVVKKQLYAAQRSIRAYLSQHGELLSELSVLLCALHLID